MADVVNVLPPDPDPPDQDQHLIMTKVDVSLSNSQDQLSSSPNTSSSTPPWIVWSKGLTALLDDPQGQELFKTYLEEEGCERQLTFLWACEGLKCTAVNDPPKIPDLIRKIYRVFIPNLVGLTDTTRTDLAQAIVDGRFTEIAIFQTAENEVLRHMKEHLYPNFLKSEIYLSACNAEDSVVVSSNGSSGRDRRQSEGEDSKVEEQEEDGAHSSHLSLGLGQTPSQSQGAAGVADTFLEEDGKHFRSKENESEADIDSTASRALVASNQLQTVHEDTELNMNTASNSTALSMTTRNKSSKKHFGLTKEALEATADQRANEFQSRLLCSNSGDGRFVKSKPVPFPYYASYSSYNPVSRVDSEIQSMSSDAMTDDGSTGGRRRRHIQGDNNNRRHGERPPQRHGGGSSAYTGDPGLGCHPGGGSSSDRSRVAVPRGAPLNPTDNLLKPVAPVQGKSSILEKSKSGPDPEKDAEGFARVIIEKLEKVQMERDKELQARALDKVREQEELSPNDILDLHCKRVFAETPTKSKSPNKARSPTTSRRKGPLPPPPYQVGVRRREKDFVASTFSVDSGNVPDSESLMIQMSDSESRVGQLPKSHSVPHELRAPSHGHSHRQPNPLGAPSSNPPPRGYHHSSRGFLERIPLGFFKRPTSTATEFIDSGISTASGLSANPPPHQLYGPVSSDALNKRLQVRDWITSSTQSNPLDLQLGALGLRKIKKPIPPELEDIREKLAQMLDVRGPSSSGASHAVPPRHSPPMPMTEATASTSTCVHTVVSYDDNKDVPYVLKIPRILNKTGSISSSGVTLGALKERLPRQGQFRYFFRTECPELGSKIVQEEISDNSQELPMLNGKIFAHLKTCRL